MTLKERLLDKIDGYDCPDETLADFMAHYNVDCCSCPLHGICKGACHATMMANMYEECEPLNLRFLENPADYYEECYEEEEEFFAAD